MKKLEQLRQYLLDAPLGLHVENLLTFATGGQVVAFAGSSNDNFELKYQANIIITDYAGAADQIAYLVLAWRKQNQPAYAGNAFDFEADIIDHEKVDLSIKLDLSEVIKVRKEAEGIYLSSNAEPLLDETLLPAGEWEAVIRHNPDGNPNQY
jgi:hypothetical protein